MKLLSDWEYLHGGQGCAVAGNVAAVGPWQTSTSFGLLLRKQKLPLLPRPLRLPPPPFPGYSDIWGISSSCHWSAGQTEFNLPKTSWSFWH